MLSRSFDPMQVFSEHLGFFVLHIRLNPAPAVLPRRQISTFCQILVICPWVDHHPTTLIAQLRNLSLQFGKSILATWLCHMCHVRPTKITLVSWGGFRFFTFAHLDLPLPTSIHLNLFLPTWVLIQPDLTVGRWTQLTGFPIPCIFADMVPALTILTRISRKTQ